MKLYKKLIKPMMLVPTSSNDYSPKQVPIEPEEKWYPEKDREILVQKYKHFETTFERLVFEDKYEEVEIPERRLWAMNKEHEARVLTLEEAKNIKTFERVWLDVRLMQNVYHLQILQFDGYPAFDALTEPIRGDWNEYQKGWVLWTNEPTKEQRWAVKWDEAD